MKKRYLILLVILAVAFVSGSCNESVSTPEPTNPSPKILASSPPPSPSPIPLKTPDRSKYKSENDGFYGLYYSNERKLVISEEDKPIPEKSNDPDEVTLPGFYLSNENRRDFEEIEIIGKNIYFKTRESAGIHYEFRGIFGEEIDPKFSDDVPIPFIKGTLKEFKRGKIVKTEMVEFGHAVIA